MRPRFSGFQEEPLVFTGGLDVVTSQLQIPPGFVRRAQNFEQAVNGGYRRISGYERFDGRDKPSDADYAVLAVTLSVAATVGETVTGGTSAATGVVIATSDGQLILTKVTGTFQAENITGSTSAVGTASGAQTVDGAGTSLLHAQYRNLAADSYRSDIAAVPGSGIIRGVWLYNDVVYAFRDNAGGTATAMYKSTTSGWSPVALGRELAFTSGGTYVMAEGDTITGATSGATAILTRVALTSGTFAAGSAAGRLIFASQTGTFQAEDLNVGANLNVATIAGNSSAITFAVPSGRFEFVNHNFGGSVNTKRMYGCDGKNRAFEFDGTVFVPIATGMTTDTPSHITAHKNQLFLSFTGSVQHSGPGTPYIFTPVTGASEIAMGDTVTGFMVQPGGSGQAALAILTRNNTAVLYGSGVASWDLVFFNQQAGGYEHTIQNVFNTVMLDDRGITTLATSQNFGNFDAATISKRIISWLATKRTTSTASMIVRDRNQYRLFFSDGSGLYITFDNGKVVGMLPMLFPDVVRCCCSGEMADGSEVAFFGSADGYVYQMERGTSFDGDAIEAYLYMVFNHSRSPRVLKTYRHVLLEVTGEGYAAFNGSYELGYAATTLEQPGLTEVTMSLASVVWDAFVWDSFVWDGITLLPSEMLLEGHAENIALVFTSSSDYYQPFTFTGGVMQFTQRRQLQAAKLH